MRRTSKKNLFFLKCTSFLFLFSTLTWKSIWDLIASIMADRYRYTFIFIFIFICISFHSLIFFLLFFQLVKNPLIQFKSTVEKIAKSQSRSTRNWCNFIIFFLFSVNSWLRCRDVLRKISDKRTNFL